MNATATFLINGAIIRRAPNRWRTILRGFPIANHTMGHVDLSRSRAPRRSGTRSHANEVAIERVLGREMLPLLRPPYGSYDRAVVRIADSLGYRTILWDVESGDTKSGATTWSVIRAATRGGKGAIVLLHCGPSVTPAAVRPIVRQLPASRVRARGPRADALAHDPAHGVPRPEPGRRPCPALPPGRHPRRAAR